MLEQLPAECEATGMRINTSKSEAAVLSLKQVTASGLGRIATKLEEFKYQWVHE